MVRNNHVVLVEELIRHGNGFIQQTARIATQVENEALNVLFADAIQVFSELRLVVSLNCSIQMYQIPVLSLIASGTLARLMASRVTSKLSGSAEPSRWTEIFTWVPRGPFSMSATSVLFR